MSLRSSKIGASVAGGLIVTAMIYEVGHISGAHMNPAVTLAFAAINHLPWKRDVQVPLYTIGQVSGALSALFTLRALLHPIMDVGTTTPSGTNMQALIMEIVVKFSMMMVASAVSTDTKALTGVAVGSAICITSILAGPVSVGSMNPARTIGPAIASSDYNGLWVYIVGPITGTLLAALSYNLVRVENKQTSPPRCFPFEL